MVSKFGPLRRWAVVLPTIAVSSWLAMLGALFGSWYTSGEPRYVSEEENQNIAFISDIGAQGLKPVFITCTSIAMSAYVPSLIAYFYYVSPVKTLPPSPPSWSAPGMSRMESLPSIYSTDPPTSLPPRQRRSLQNSLLFHISLPCLSIIFSLIGATNLILLTIFDTARHARAHQLLLPTSIACHLLGCLILCIWTIICLRQYQYSQQQPPYGTGDSGIYSGDKLTLELYASQTPISLASLIVKSVIVAFEFALAALFAVTTWLLKTLDMAAVMEWIVVLMFAGYMLCLIVDMWVLGTRPGGLNAVESRRMAQV